jgi:predicted ATP-binding protein involved in virulence
MGKTVNPDEKGDLSRFMGYYLAIDPRCSPKELMKWLKRQEWISYKQKRQPTGLMVVKRALVGCIEEASDIAFDPEREELVLFFKEGPELPFGMLSDGQRGIAALVGDLAMRASRLNPQFGESVLEETPGVVLIDEVDLYLHPKWQRTILGNLSYVFPKIQFVCTTHSPQVVGGIGPECIINLDTGAKSAGQSLGLDSNSVLRQIMGATERDTETLKLLERVYSKLEEDDLEGATAALDVVRARLRGPDSETVRLETTIHNLETLKED